MPAKTKTKRNTSKANNKLYDTRFLNIKPPAGKMDPLVQDSIKHTGLWCLDLVKPDLPNKKGAKGSAVIRKFLYDKLLKYAPHISVITKKMNTDSALINAKTRSLLSNRDIYMYLLYDTIKTAAQRDIPLVQNKSSDENAKGSVKGQGKKVSAIKKTQKAKVAKKGTRGGTKRATKP